MENDLYIAEIIFWCTPKKIGRGCLRVRPDANANHSKTICRPPFKGGRHNEITLTPRTMEYSQFKGCCGLDIFFAGLDLFITCTSPASEFSAE